MVLYCLSWDRSTDSKTETKNQIRICNKKEAVSAARRVEAEIENGPFVKETKMTFEMFAQDWIKVYSQNAKVSSVRARSKEMKHFISV